MFFVLNPVEITGNMFAARRMMREISKAAPRSVSTRSGIPFYVLDVAVRSGRADWEKVSAYAARGRKFLFPESLEPPDNSGIAPFVPTRLPPVITFNTAVALIKRSGLSPLGLNIVLADKNASLTQLTDSLFPLASNVTVITKKPHKYAAAAQRIMENFGASLVVTDRPAFSEKSVVIAADPDNGFSPYRCAVISQIFQFPDCLSFRAGRLPRDTRYDDFLPRGIDAVDFYSAVFELCASSEHFGLCHETLFFGQQEFSLQECAKILYGTINNVKS